MHQTNKTMLPVSAAAVTVLRCLASGLNMESAKYIASLGTIKPINKESK